MNSIVRKNNSKTKEINKEGSEVDSILCNFERLFGYPAKGSNARTNLKQGKIF